MSEKVKKVVLEDLKSQVNGGKKLFNDDRSKKLFNKSVMSGKRFFSEKIQP